MRDLGTPGAVHEAPAGIMTTMTNGRGGHLDLTLASIAIVLLGSSGCRAIEGIFKAGVWTGILGFILLLAIVLGVLRMISHSRA
ncbi:MAG: hypothetical protein JWO86_4723 [Myxococcaceae bacterium]|jgi:hypothetical protein|nr:hypothetical protein [Myxococcaceae bacterium]MEA2748279.1 hypothetical protein [Myxococcales bacterium]